MGWLRDYGTVQNPRAIRSFFCAETIDSLKGHTEAIIESTREAWARRNNKRVPVCLAAKGSPGTFIRKGIEK